MFKVDNCWPKGCAKDDHVCDVSRRETSHVGKLSDASPCHSHGILTASEHIAPIRLNRGGWEPGPSRQRDMRWQRCLWNGACCHPFKIVPWIVKQNREQLKEEAEASLARCTLQPPHHGADTGAEGDAGASIARSNRRSRRRKEEADALFRAAFAAEVSGAITQSHRHLFR